VCNCAFACSLFGIRASFRGEVLIRFPREERESEGEHDGHDACECLECEEEFACDAALC